MKCSSRRHLATGWNSLEDCPILLIPKIICSWIACIVGEQPVTGCKQKALFVTIVQHWYFCKRIKIGNT